MYRIRRHIYISSSHHIVLHSHRVKPFPGLPSWRNHGILKMIYLVHSPAPGSYQETFCFRHHNWISGTVKVICAGYHIHEKIVKNCVRYVAGPSKVPIFHVIDSMGANTTRLSRVWRRLFISDSAFNWNMNIPHIWVRLFLVVVFCPVDDEDSSHERVNRLVLSPSTHALKMKRVRKFPNAQKVRDSCKKIQFLSLPFGHSAWELANIGSETPFVPIFWCEWFVTT